MKQVFSCVLPFSVIQEFNGRDLRLFPEEEYKLVVKDKTLTFKTGPMGMGLVGISDKVFELCAKEFPDTYSEINQITTDHERKIVVALVS